MPSHEQEGSTWHRATRTGTNHDHASLPSVRAPYLDFVDELFRLGQIDAGKRDFLRRGARRVRRADADSRARIPSG